MTEILTGTAVSAGGQGLLIVGASGKGKSALAMDLISRGAQLIADDKVEIADGLLSPPSAIAGLIEARGMGILSLPYVSGVPLTLIADLDAPAPARLPQEQKRMVLGRAIPLIPVANPREVAPALLLRLLHGRHA